MSKRIPIDKKYFNVYYPIEKVGGLRLAYHIQLHTRRLYPYDPTTYSKFIYYLLYVTPNGRHLRIRDKIESDAKS